MAKKLKKGIEDKKEQSKHLHKTPLTHPLLNKVNTYQVPNPKLV
jgi:hypothetical protein